MDETLIGHLRARATSAVRAGVVCAVASAFFAGAAQAGGIVAPHRMPDGFGGITPVAHGLEVLRVVTHIQGSVAAVGRPDENGNVYSFTTNDVDLSVDQVQHWRLTLVSGERFASEFQIRTNSDNEVTVFSLDGPLNGIAEGDLFLIENVFAPRRYDGAVTAVGDLDVNGDVFSFSGDASGFAPGELRQWRVTFLSGRRFASVFEIADNTETEIVVSPVDGPLNGVSIGDRFFIENAPIGRGDTNTTGSATTN